MLTESVTRARSKTPHRSFKLTKKYKKIQKPLKKIPGSFSLIRQSAAFYWLHKRMYGSLTLIYLLLVWAIVGLPSQSSYQDLKTAIGESLDGNLTGLYGIGGLTVGAFTGTFSPETSELQDFLIALTGLFFWLFFIWSTRYLQSGSKITIRQTFYTAAAPIIPLLVVSFIIALQLIPAVVGSYILGYTFFSNELAIQGVEAMLFVLGAVLLITLSVYWVIQSLFAFIIVTLPDVYPLAAMRSAKTLVSGRRVAILLRICSALLISLLVWLCIVVPVIILEANVSFGPVPVVPALINVLAAITVPVIIIYLYRLYRELL